jgi:hypothetical protein
MVFAADYYIIRGCSTRARVYIETYGVQYTEYIGEGSVTFEAKLLHPRSIGGNDNENPLSKRCTCAESTSGASLASSAMFQIGWNLKWKGSK